MEEIWKDVAGYEGFYKVSNMGNVRSVKRNLVLRPGNNTHGYNTVVLHKHGKGTTKTVHRIVASTFIPDPQATVNHINGIKTDNRVENLQWATVSENCLHAHRSGLCPKPKGKKPGCKNMKTRMMETLRQKYEFNQKF